MPDPGQEAAGIAQNLQMLRRVPINDLAPATPKREAWISWSDTANLLRSAALMANPPYNRFERSVDIGISSAYELTSRSVSWLNTDFRQQPNLCCIIYIGQRK
jgi:hypothetical protein